VTENSELKEIMERMKRDAEEQQKEIQRFYHDIDLIQE